jgi:hypothetical protein
MERDEIPDISSSLSKDYQYLVYEKPIRTHFKTGNITNWVFQASIRLRIWSVFRNKYMRARFQ